MSKVYLQEKLSGQTDQYIVVGEDGFLRAGDIQAGSVPTIHIVVSSNATSVIVRHIDNTTIPTIKLSDTLYTCNPTKFGVWNVYVTVDGETVDDNIEVSEITYYEVDMTTPPWPEGKLASDYAVGDSVYLPINGVTTEFLVVHQGNPDSSIYSTTFENSTTLLMKDCYEVKDWDSSRANDYENSTLHSYLNSSFLALFDANTQSVIKQVKVPYHKGYGTSQTVTSGENGLSCKIFLLSMTEVGFSESYQPTSEGAKLAYFESGTETSARNKRIAYLDGNVKIWWLRSPYYSSTVDACAVLTNGLARGGACDASEGVRPALVINNTTLFDENNVIIR